MKNDHTYEYRVFTNRLVDVGPMEVGNCTRKVIDNLKSKDKVDGRFFHTSDSNEWFFCWNGELQELNLSGDASVNEALKEVEKLIGDANEAVKQALEAAKSANEAAESIKNKVDQDYVDGEIATVNKIATEAKATADAAKQAADDANAAVESIEGKADMKYVDDEIEKVNSTATAAKATAEEVKSNVDVLSSLVKELPSSKDIVTTSDLNDYAKTSDLEVYAKSSDLDGVIKSTDLESYATKEFVGEEIKKEIPTNVSDLTNDVGYLTKDIADGYYAALGTTGSGVDKNYVDDELAKKQDKIDDIEDIRKGAAKGAAAEAYTNSKSEEVLNAAKKHSDGAADDAKNEVITYADKKFQEKGDYAFKSEIPSDYYTKSEIDTMIATIEDQLGDALKITKEILA